MTIVVSLIVPQYPKKDQRSARNAGKVWLSARSPELQPHGPKIGSVVLLPVLDYEPTPGDVRILHVDHVTTIELHQSYPDAAVPGH